MSTTQAATGTRRTEPRGSSFYEVGNYMEEIGRVSLLTCDEEIILARQVQAMIQLIDEGKTKDNLTKKEKIIWRSGQKAKERMVAANLRLVVTVAKKYAARICQEYGGAGLDFSDLIQEGSLGLVRAVEKFDPERGYKFSTYSYWWIKQSIVRALAEKQKTIRLPIHTEEALAKMRKKEVEILKKTGRKPSVKQLAEETGVSQQNAELYFRSAARCLSLDFGGEDGDCNIHEVIPDKSVDQEFELLYATTDLHSLVMALPGRVQYVINRYYGLEDNKPVSFAYLARELQISRERVRQLAERGIHIIQYQLSHGTHLKSGDDKEISNGLQMDGRTHRTGKRSSPRREQEKAMIRRLAKEIEEKYDLRQQVA